MNLSSEILDEIALEGLDGITIEALWVRLLMRKDFVLLPKDELSKVYIWNIVRRLADVEFYKLQQPRQPLVVFNRWSNLEDDLGMVMEPNPIPVDIYPHVMVSDTVNKVQGSCSTYYTRENVTNTIRKLKLPEILEKYGAERIVIVASQDTRRVALMGTSNNPQLELTDFQYCCLERIGRSRYHGEVTQGKMGLQLLGVDAKLIFYFRKFLLKQKLITRQVFHMKTNNVHTGGRLLHLPRFYRLVKPKFVTLTETIIDFLMTQPEYMCEVSKLKESLGISCSLRKLTKLPDFQRYVRSDPRAPYRVVYPDADTNDWKRKASDKEKRVHVLYLVDPSCDVKEIQRKLEGNDEDDNDEEEDAESYSHGFLDQSTRCFDRPLVLQVWKILEAAGPNGLSASELTQALCMTKLNMRAICKHMLKSNMIGSFLADVAKQRVTRYVVNRLWSVTAEFTSEELKFSNLTNTDNKVGMFNEAGEGCSRYMNETILPGDDNYNNACISTTTVNETCNESMEIVEEDSGENGKKEGEDVFVEAKVRKDYCVVEEKDERNEKEKEEVDKKGIEEERRDEDAMTLESSSKELKQSRSRRKSLKRPKDGGKDTVGSSSPKKFKLKVKTITDLNNENKIDDSLENVENSVSEPMNVSTESCSDKTNVTTDLETFISEPSVSGETVCPKEDDVCNIVVETTDDLNWLRVRGKLGKDHSSNAYKTVKTLKRWNWILETVQTHKVISSLKNLCTVIDDNENADGSNTHIDRKSLLRILYKMAMDRLIKVYKVTLKSGDIIQEMTFICNSSVASDDHLIKISVDLAKLKFTSKIKLQNAITMKQQNRASIAKEEMVLTDKFDFSEEHKSKLDVPKFMRMRYLHIFMYYLVYGYEGSVDLDQQKAAEQIRASQGFEENDLESMSFIYVPNASWKMFVPPLPQHREYKNGWALLADVLLRLPLSMFLQLVRLSYTIPNLELYVDHPIKRHILVKDLPVPIRNCLTFKRKYIFSISEVMTRLGYIGLIQMGPQSFKDKDHVYVYINKNALLLDTKPSGPGYHKVSEDMTYNEIRYSFNTMMDVERYWLDMWKICMHTKLGSRSCVVGTQLILENIQDKQEMTSVLKARTREEVLEKDVGYLPGDKSGAAGFDSALFSHLKRNWSFKPISRTRQSVLTIPEKPNQNKKRPFKLPEGKNLMVYSLLAKRRKNLIVTARKQSTTITKSTVHRKHTLSHKPRVTVRNVKPKRNVIHSRPYYDQVDREALQRMNKLRVDWSKAEDKVLLLCKVVQSMIEPQSKSSLLGNMYISAREILHKTLPGSRNKTSRACQRRTNYMLRSQSTCHSLNLCIEELRHDATIMETYGDLFEKLRDKYTNKAKVIENKPKMVAEWNMHYKNLFDILAKRFDNFSMFSLSSVTSTMPDTLEEFYAQYNVIEPTKKVRAKHRYNPVGSVNDVYSSVINSIIHSALSCSSDKTSWSYHLFSVYQQYPEKLLRSALADMRRSLMVSLKRTWSRTKMRSGNYLPLTASPYRLSISYINLMTSKYTFDIFAESYELMKTIAQSKQVDVQTFTGGTTAGVVHLETDELVDFEIGIPDQVIVLNPNIQEKDEKYTRLMKRYKEILCSYKQDLLTTSCLFQKDNYSTVNSIEDAVDIDDDGRDNLSNNTIARTASRIALYLVKDSEEVGGLIPQDLQHVHDFFVVNSCSVVSNLRSNLTEDQLKIITDMHDVQIFQKNLRENVIFPGSFLIDLNEDVVLKENYTGDRYVEAVKLLELAKSEGKLGLKCGRIIEEFGNDFRVKQILDELCRLKLLICTGVVYTTYVHYKHARPWLVHTYQNKRKDRDNRVPMVGGVMELGQDDVEGEVIDERSSKEDTLFQGEHEPMEGVIEEDASKDKRTGGFVESDPLFVENDVLMEEKRRGEGGEKERMFVVDVMKSGNNSENKEEDDNNSIVADVMKSRNNSENKEEENDKNLIVVDVGNKEEGDNAMEVDCEKVEQEEKEVGGMEGENIDDKRRGRGSEEEEECVKVFEERNLVENNPGEEVQENKEEFDKRLRKKNVVEFASGEEEKVQENIEEFVEVLGENNTVDIFGKGEEKVVFDKDLEEETPVEGRLVVQEGEKEFDEGLAGEKIVDGSSGKEGLVQVDKQDYEKRLSQNKPVESSCSEVEEKETCASVLEGNNSVESTSGALLQDKKKQVFANELRENNYHVQINSSSMEILVQEDNDKEYFVEKTEQIIPAEGGSSFKDTSLGEGCSKNIIYDIEEENTDIELNNRGNSEKRVRSDEECESSSGIKKVRLHEDLTSIAETSRKTRSISKSDSLHEPASAKDTDNRNLAHPIKILMRPWVKIDGSINRRCLDYLLSMVLSHIMLHPLSTLAELQERFMPALQPQHTRELADSLQDMKCIDSYVCERVGTVSLFSKPCEVVIRKATGLEPATDIRYEADRDAIVNLGKLISTKQYNQSYMAVLINK